jgi:hypothetical protein
VRGRSWVRQKAAQLRGGVQRYKMMERKPWRQVEYIASMRVATRTGRGHGPLTFEVWMMLYAKFVYPALFQIFVFDQGQRIKYSIL